MAAKKGNSAPRPIIIKKVVENHEEDHGGAWKVAYADFVTAMMAFFLMLWILAAVEEDKLEGLADYFQPTLFKQKVVSGEGVLSGVTLGEEGVFNSSNSPMLSVPTPLVGRDDPGKQEDVPDPSEVDVMNPSGHTATAYAVVEVEQQVSEERRQEEAVFDDVAETIVQAMQQLPDLKPLIPNVVFTQTEEGLLIEIVDQERRPMFPLGRADMLDNTRDLMALVATAVADLPNSLSITGHTDSLPFSTEENGYGNWELSADRANATRRVLQSAGIPPERIAGVSGVADTDPILPEDPTAAMNRRISILLNYSTANTSEAAADVSDAEATPQADPVALQGAGEETRAAGVAKQTASPAQPPSAQQSKQSIERIMNGHPRLPEWAEIDVQVE